MAHTLMRYLIENESQLAAYFRLSPEGLNDLIHSVARYVEEGRKPDLIFATRDIAYGGIKTIRYLSPRIQGSEDGFHGRVGLQRVRLNREYFSTSGSRTRCYSNSGTASDRQASPQLCGSFGEAGLGLGLPLLFVSSQALLKHPLPIRSTAYSSKKPRSSYPRTQQ